MNKPEDLTFISPEMKDAAVLQKYIGLRPCRACDSVLLDTFIWRDYYQIEYAVIGEDAMLLRMRDGDEIYGAIPYCRQEDLPVYFDLFRRYFNEVLHLPFKIYLADEEAVEYLKLREDDRLFVREEFDLKDYLYDGEKIRTFAGKKFQKKRNLVNKFKRDYEGRWEYRSYTPDQYELYEAFLLAWCERRRAEEDAEAGLIDVERDGVLRILGHSGDIDCHIGGIWIDGKLSAFSIGALNQTDSMAEISTEKADSDIPGIYQMIFQQFVLHEFPDAALVNREDDMGLAGLRQSKESYNPVGYERKYMVAQKDFGNADLTDHYEEEIAEENERAAEDAEKSGREGTDTASV